MTWASFVVSVVPEAPLPAIRDSESELTESGVGAPLGNTVGDEVGNAVGNLVGDEVGTVDGLGVLSVGD